MSKAEWLKGQACCYPFLDALALYSSEKTGFPNDVPVRVYAGYP
jgi:hypothetical protein